MWLVGKEWRVLLGCPDSLLPPGITGKFFERRGSCFLKDSGLGSDRAPVAPGQSPPLGDALHWHTLDFL